MDQQTYYLIRAIASCFQAFGVLIAVTVFIYSILRNRKQRAIDRYEDLTESWMDFLNACLKNPDLDIGVLSVPETGNEEMSAEKERRLNVAFIKVLVLFERIFVLDSVVKSPAKIKSDAFEHLLRSYLYRDSFRRVFSKSKHLFDERFIKFADGIILKIKSKETQKDIANHGAE